MDALSGFVQLLAGIAVVIGIITVVHAPELLVGMFAGFAQSKRDDREREMRQQAEIERKLAIAEAAIEARKRGETFVPPKDYDR